LEFTIDGFDFESGFFEFFDGVSCSHFRVGLSVDERRNTAAFRKPQEKSELFSHSAHLLTQHDAR
jgi:hypothetical protein